MALGDDARETVIFSFGALILSAMAVWSVHAAMTIDGRKWARSVFVAVRGVIRPWIGRKVEDDVRKVVDSQLERQKVQQFVRTCACLCFLYGIGTFIWMSKLLTGAAQNTSLCQDVAQLTVHGTLAVVLLRPNLVTPKTIDAFYTVIILSTAVYVAPFSCENPSMMLLSIIGYDFSWAALLMSRRSPCATIPTSLVYAASASATLWMYVEEVLTGITPRHIASMHFAFLMGLVVVGVLLDSAMIALLRQGIEMENTKELLGAACAVLRSMCDVVVELDASGKIAGPAYDLGTFLLKGPGYRFQNRKLADFLSKEEDKKMFERKLHSETPSGEGLADALHVDMKDGDRNMVRVELFSFRYRHLDNQPRYMVGLREFADHIEAGCPKRIPERAERKLQTQLQEPGEAAEEVALAPRLEEPDGPAPVCRPERLLEVANEAFDLSQRRSSASDCGLSDSSSDMCSASSDPTPAVVTVDMTSEGLPVVGLSAGFQMRVGRLPPGTRLLNLVDQASLKEFIKWLQAAVAKQGRPSTRVTLKLRQGRVKAIISVFKEAEGEPVVHNRFPLLVSGIKITRGPSDDCKGTKPYTDFRGTPGTPRERTIPMAL